MATRTRASPQADVIVERDFNTKATHQGYIEPHACVADCRRRRPGRALGLHPGPLHGPQHLRRAARHRRRRKIRVTPSEIGGGFGGKTTVFIEPVALALSRKAGRPVKIVMTRDEVFRATGPTSGTSITRQDRREEGRHASPRPRPSSRFQAGAFPGSPVEFGAMAAFACYDLENVKIDRLRRRVQPAEGGRLPRARRAEGGVRGRERDRRAGREARHGSDRAAPEERGQGGRPRPPTGRPSARSA